MPPPGWQSESGRRCNAPRLVERIRFEVEASVGIVIASNADTPRALLQRADTALREAKTRHSGIATYNGDTDSRAPYRLSLLADLRQALASRDELRLHYQPQLCLSTGRVSGLEALLRWRHPDHGMVPPADFIPIAEGTGIIGPVTEYVLTTALTQSREWLDDGIDVPIAVNVSARNLHDPTLPALLRRLLDAHRIPARLLTLEITEGAVMQNPDHARRTLEQLRSWGIGLSLDDFGTGYSSMTYLKDLPVSEVKIDQSFVMNMTAEPKHAMIVSSIIDLAHNLGLTVTAEGIETPQTLHRLRELGCDTAQGYLIGKPSPAEATHAWLIARAHQAPATAPALIAPPAQGGL